MEFDDHTSNDTGETPEAHDVGPAPNSKRRLIISSAPLLITIANRPAWANMCSVSGAMSGPHSGQPHVEACLGCTPGFWKNNYAAWPFGDPGLEIPGILLDTGDCVKKDGTLEDPFKKNCKIWAEGSGTLFDDPLLFPNAAVDLGLSGLSLMNVLWFATKNGGNVPFAHAFGGHIVAGLFNSASFSEEYGYTAQGFVNMIEAAFSGSFPAGINTQEELKDLLDTNNNRGCPLNAHGDPN